MAAGLAHMVAAMSRGKKAYLQYEAQLSEAIGRLATLREELKAAIDADAESYNVVMKAYRAARETDDGGVGVNAALRQATSVPLGVAERAAEVARIARCAEADYESEYGIGSDDRDCAGWGGANRSVIECGDQSRIDEGWNRRKMMHL